MTAACIRRDKMTVVDPDLREVQRVDHTIDIWLSVLLGHSHPSVISSRDDITVSRVPLADHSETKRD
jgi:hypothetical protein